MLSERDQTLLTAYVDGELSRHEKREVARLLRESREARALFRQLRDDANKLRSLPTPPLPMDLSDSVLQELSRRQLRRIRRELQTEPQTVPSWLGMAMAASVLMVVGLASYWFFANTTAPAPVEPATVVQDDRPVPDPEQPGPMELPDPTMTEDPAPDPMPELPDPGELVVPEAPAPVVPSPKPAPPRAPVSPRPFPPIFGSNPSDRHELKRVELVPPAVFSLAQFGDRKVRDTLRRYLEGGSAFRLELPCRDGTAAMKLLQAIAKKNDLGFVLTPLAEARLEKPQWKTSYLLYLENLTPAELVSLIHQLQQRDKKNAKNPGEWLLRDLVVNHLASLDRKELHDLSGVDILESAVGPLGVDLRTPLADQTADQLAQALGQKDAPATRPSKDEPSRFALTFAYNMAQAVPRTEVQRYLASRQPLQRGGLQVVLVFRIP